MRAVRLVSAALLLAVVHDVTATCESVALSALVAFTPDALPAPPSRGVATPDIASVLREHADLVAAVHGGVLVYRRPDGVVLDRQLAANGTTSEQHYYFMSTDSADESGRWTTPFYDCFTEQWVSGVSLSLPGGGSTRVFQALDRCNESLSSVFGGSQRCDLETTTCVPMVAGNPRRDLGYSCQCRSGFFANYTDDEVDAFRCMPCVGLCRVCDDTGRCMVVRDLVVKTVIVGVQSLCMAGTLLLGVIVFKKRKCKTISTGMWTILEMILVGVFILYATVVVRFFDPSKEQCLVEPWCRELGFVICYGAIILKLYRILIEFRTRKAHRWVVRDKDLLKYLLGMVVMAVGYMAAWTAATLNFIEEDYSILRVGTTHDGQHFLACKSLWWDYVTQTGEILILIFGIHLSFACRNATTQFHERRFLCLAIVVEATVSGAYYLLRAVYSETLHPDYTYMASFARSQLTSTIVVALIFTPKLWYQKTQLGTNNLSQLEAQVRLPMDAFKPQDGETDPGDINLADMNPDDIRAELKRLYTQLEVLKNKTIRADNPHISKRRGGRKVAHRRFSLQALHHRHQRHSTRHHGHDHDGAEGEVSRTPEDSVCSVEGPSVVFNDGPSTHGDVTPNVQSNRRQ